MALQYATTLRNAQLDTIETVVGASPLLRFYTGSAPTNCASEATGTMLLEISLPTDWLNAAASGTKSKSGTWSAVAVGTGTCGYYRIYNSAGSTCYIQGSITVTGGGGDITMDTPGIAAGQTVTIGSYALAAANA